MITTEHISAFIRQPETVKGPDASDLNEIISKYPYCSSLYLLQLKGMANANDLHFEDQLKKVAVNVMDREHLYRLIHSESSDVILELKVEEELTESNAEPIAEYIEETPELTQPHDEVEEEILEDNREVEILEESLNETIVNSVIESAFEIKADEVPEKTEIHEAETTAEVIAPIEEANSVPLSKAAPTEIDTSNLSFIEWLKFKNTGTISKQVDVDTDEINTIISFDLPTKDEKLKDTKSEIDALLDKFIEEEPSISKPVKEFYSPSKSAKESLEERADLVSETLAKIHVLQKNYDKAISAYQQLSLLYPEKKVFFANQIKKIKEEQSGK